MSFWRTAICLATEASSSIGVADAFWLITFEESRPAATAKVAILPQFMAVLQYFRGRIIVLGAASAELQSRIPCQSYRSGARLSPGSHASWDHTWRLKPIIPYAIHAVIRYFARNLSWFLRKAERL